MFASKEPRKYDRYKGLFPFVLSAVGGLLLGTFVGFGIGSDWSILALVCRGVAVLCLVALLVMVFDRIIVERTHRKLAVASSESERLLRQLTENIREVLWLRSSKGVHYMSPSYEKVMGVSLNDYYRNYRDWLKVVHPEDLSHVEKSLDESLVRGGEYEEEFRILRPPDGELRWIHIRAFPLEPEEGETFRVAGLTEDVTQRRQLEEQLRQSQKMEAVGQLAGGVAHDFNNILQVILGYGECLRDSIENRPDSGEDSVNLDNIMDAGERAMVLVRQLLNFSRRVEFTPVSVDLNAVVSDLLKMLKRLLGPNVQITQVSSPRLPLVKADPGQIEQVLINLCVNARDAMPEGGRIQISLQQYTPSDEWKGTHPEVAEECFVELAIADTGTGIPSDLLDHIFEPFYTTKEVGKGTGLGLATVYAIVTRHQGFIEVDSEEEVGTTFRILLPVACEEGEVIERQPDRPTIEVTGGHELLLLAEDDDLVRRFLNDTLRKRNYRVLSARDGQEALELFREHHDEISLVLCDLVMPRLGGAAVYYRVRDRRPDLPFIFFSGYDEALLMEHDVADAGTILRKPVAARDLLAQVRSALETAVDEGISAKTL